MEIDLDGVDGVLEQGKREKKNARILELGHGFKELTAGEDFTRSIFICSGDFSL